MVVPDRTKGNVVIRQETLANRRIEFAIHALTNGPREKSAREHHVRSDHVRVCLFEANPGFS